MVTHNACIKCCAPAFTNHESLLSSQTILHSQLSQNVFLLVVKIFENRLLICMQLLCLLLGSSMVDERLRHLSIQPISTYHLGLPHCADAEAPLKLCGLKSQSSASDSTSLNYLNTISLLTGPCGRA